MDSRSRRLPFSVSGSRSSYTSSPSFSTSSSSSLGSSRLYGRERVLSSDCFPRASSTLKPDADHQSSRYLSSTRDYSSSDSRSASWKLPSPLTTSTTSYDRPWADSSLSSRNKLSDSERRLGAYSGLLNTSDDGDSKRAKLSCSNRGAYSRTPSTSVTGSLYSSNVRGSGTVAGAKQTDTWIDSPWSSCRLLSRSSSSSSSTSPKPLLSRRELETRHEPSLSGLGESRVRNPALASSLYQSDRVTSTYAQGARPKETLYSSSSSSSSSTARESSLSRHLSSTPYRSSPLVRDFSTRTAARSLTNSSDLHSSQEQTGTPKSTSAISSSSSSSHTPSWYTSPLAREDADLPSSPTAPAPPAPRPAPEGGESEGRRSTRRLLSRLFSRRSSQDSSGGSSSARSFDSADDGSSTGGEAADGEEEAAAARPPGAEPDARGSETAQAFAFLRRRRLDLAPIQETHGENRRGGPAQPSMEGWREPGASSNNNSSSSGGGGGGGSSWLSASLRNRCPPLFSRHRREGRDESTRSAAGDGCSHLQSSLRRWDNPARKASEDEDDDEDDEEEDEDDEEEVGAVGVEVPGAAGASTVPAERAPGRLRDAVFLTPPPPRVRVYEDIIVAVDDSCSRPDGPEKDKPLPSRDPERLRKIQESLLLEESDEEEGDLCRICQMGEDSASNPLIEPCSCTGSLQYVHQECIKKWLCSKVSSGTNLEAITTCELCKEKLHLNIDNFDINELYKTHVQSEYEFISSGLYLVVLLHLCEQRFSDVLGAANEAGFFNLARTLHEHMDNLESPPGETDEEVEWLQNTRPPTIDFSDLDDDLEEEY